MDSESSKPTNVGSNDQLGLVEELRLIAAWHLPRGSWPGLPQPDRYRVCVAAAKEIESLRAALKWYADGEHFIKSDSDAWDTVSGEPQNWWCDEAGTATVEDGTLAGMALGGKMINRCKPWQKAKRPNSPADPGQPAQRSDER